MKKILLIDDDDFFHHIFYVIFREQYIIDSATSVDKVYEYIFSIKYDLIIVDISLNKRDTGKVLIREMRKLSCLADTPIVCCTAYSSAIKKREVMDAGADYFLTKPIESSKIKRIVDFFMKHQRKYSSLKELYLSY